MHGHNQHKMFSVKQFTSTSSLVSYRFKSKILFGTSRNFCTGKVESNSIRLKPFPRSENTTIAKGLM